MGHAEHFLRRLDRVADHHVELALTLYRDEELLREVLARAGLEPGIDRLAITLDDPSLGPFVIVTRTGRFVTCLGPGMRVGTDASLVVLPRARLDAAIAKVERMRERVTEVERLRASGGDGVAARVFGRMGRSGLCFCREDAAALLEVWPLVGRAAAGMLITLLAELRRNRKRVAALRWDKLRGGERELALAYGNAAWAAAHLLVLTDHEVSMVVFDEAAGAQLALGEPRLLAAATLFDLGTYAHGVRSVWALARRPRRVIAGLKSFDQDPRDAMRTLRELGLGAIAIASPKWRAEATKALSSLAEGDEGGAVERRPGEDALAYADRALSAYGDALGSMVRAAIADQGPHAQDATEYGRLVAARFVHDRVEVSPEEMLAIPEDVANAWIASLPVSFLGAQGAERMLQLVTALPWVARVGAADLFLPRAYAEQLPATALAHVEMMMAPYAEQRGLGRPATEQRETPKIGRNDPCPCGSGKKHKRCCAAA